MINIQLKTKKTESFCPICFAHINQSAIDKHLDDAHPRTGYIAKGNIPLLISRHALDYLCPDCYLTYETIDSLKEHFSLVHKYSIREQEKVEEIRKEKTTSSDIHFEPKVEKSTDFALYVYDALVPTRCTDGTSHKAENVTLETKTSNDIPVRFNVFYCSKCKKYYTNIEALERKFPLHNYPLIKLHFQSDNPYERRAFSDLTLYGYTARAGALTEYERQNILIRVMVNQFLSKKEIIGTLKSNINYNGRASHMGNAVKIWETDIEFVSKFRLDLQKTIQLDTVKIIYKGTEQKK